MDTDRSAREDKDVFRDPLESIRSGDDFEDDTNSKMSDFVYMNSLNRDQL